MFNTDITVNNNNQSNSQTINNNEASTGQLIKISKTSKIVRFAKGSQLEKQFFSDEPYITKKRTVYYQGNMYRLIQMEDSYETTDKYSIDVLQIIIFGNNQYLVEYEIGEKIY